MVKSLLISSLPISLGYGLRNQRYRIAHDLLQNPHADIKITMPYVIQSRESINYYQFCLIVILLPPVRYERMGSEIGSVV